LGRAKRSATASGSASTAASTVRRIPTALGSISSTAIRVTIGVAPQIRSAAAAAHQTSAASLALGFWLSASLVMAPPL
jgi:hypothetical protein